MNVEREPKEVVGGIADVIAIMSIVYVAEN